MVPNGCSTVSRRSRIACGFSSSRCWTASRTSSCSQRETRRCLLGVLTGQFGKVAEEEFESSLLNTFFEGVFRDDPDAADKIRLIEELAGCVALGFGTRLRSPKAVILYGPSAGNGKSQMQEMLRGLADPRSVSAIPPTKLSDEKYAVQLSGKVLNTFDELGDRAIRKDAFKSAITGEPIAARDLYCSATFVRPIAQHIFATNTLPTFPVVAPPSGPRRFPMAAGGVLLVLHPPSTKPPTSR